MSYSNWKLIAEAVKARIITAIGTASGLQFTLTDHDLTQIRKVPWNIPELTQANGFGCILFPTTQTRAVATNLRDDVGYGVGIIIYAATNRETEDGLDDIVFLRENAEENLREKRLNDVGVHRIIIESPILIDESSFKNQYDLSSFVARCVRRQGT